MAKPTVKELKEELNSLTATSHKLSEESDNESFRKDFLKHQGEYQKKLQELEEKIREAHHAIGSQGDHVAQTQLCIAYMEYFNHLIWQGSFGQRVSMLKHQAANKISTGFKNLTANFRDVAIKDIADCVTLEENKANGNVKLGFKINNNDLSQEDTKRFQALYEGFLQHKGYTIDHPQGANPGEIRVLQPGNPPTPIDLKQLRRETRDEFTQFCADLHKEADHINLPKM
ncbi:MAG: hypothetical protein A3F18_05710 [Legionellales bacterium RIFCSPHIGHO2_12_FULL_37_14]|nr:MAG: hypothetical protein A3F18_05710 [Legionellales bacterium RIFCSPHIGHO2_12_FULL_37_14]